MSYKKQLIGNPWVAPEGSIVPEANRLRGYRAEGLLEQIRERPSVPPLDSDFQRERELEEFRWKNMEDVWNRFVKNDKLFQPGFINWWECSLPDTVPNPIKHFKDPERLNIQVKRRFKLNFNFNN